MQAEEGGGVHVGNVMLFGHVAGGPVGVVCDGDLVAVLEGEGREESEEGEEGGRSGGDGWVHCGRERI